MGWTGSCRFWLRAVWTSAFEQPVGSRRFWCSFIEIAPRIGSFLGSGEFDREQTFFNRSLGKDVVAVVDDFVSDATLFENLRGDGQLITAFVGVRSTDEQLPWDSGFELFGVVGIGEVIGDGVAIIEPGDPDGVVGTARAIDPVGNTDLTDELDGDCHDRRAGRRLLEATRLHSVPLFPTAR